MCPDTELLDLEEPLGDAREVYEVEAESPLSFDGCAAGFSLNPRDRYGKVSIDDIHDGTIALLSVSEDEETRFASGAWLDADDARQLGAALLRAAEYADDQTGSRQ